jgi:two-component system cell cycle sensor histidine kinase/response regulator CckA
MKKILVVDNHPMMLRFMAQLFEKEGHEVIGVGDGLEALDLLKTLTPDLIFTDLVMSDVDGRKLCQVLRRMPRFDRVPIVILSAIACEQEIDVAAFGANACIAKGPFDQMAGHLRAVVRRLEDAPSAVLSQETLGVGDLSPRRITRELLSIKKHFEAILSVMREGIMEITGEGRIAYANPSAIDLAGIPEERLLASSFLDLIPLTDRSRVEKQIRAALDGPSSPPPEIPLLLNGRQTLLGLLGISDREPPMVIALFEDVTERKRMEAQLLQAQKMEAIGTLAGGIAHDFNNLLMVILGNVSLMLHSLPAEAPHSELLRNIENQVRNGSRLTGQLLGFARKGRYEVRPVALNTVVGETTEAFHRTRKEITLRLNLAPDLATVEADSGQMEQMLMNLLVNASDAMPGHGEIALVTRNTGGEEADPASGPSETDRYVFLSVSDSGVGMDSPTLERIFDPFFTTKDRGRGTGLGLAAVYGIVHGHGGRIYVDSAPGMGTTFRIYLPASKRATAPKAGPATAPSRGSETLLLVDDEEKVLEVSRKLLEALGYDVLAAGDGTTALELYRINRGRINLVILDLVMPGMGGTEVYEKLREIDPAVRVLVSSGYSMDGEARKVLDRGGRGFIQKPFSLRELSGTIRRILDDPQKERPE